MKSTLKRSIWVVVILFIATVGYLSYEHWIKKEPLPDGLIQANGRIEGDHVAIASKFSGQIEKLVVIEGDTVKTGQVVAVLDDSQVQARASVQAGAWDPAVYSRGRGGGYGVALAETIFVQTVGKECFINYERPVLSRSARNAGLL